jgi:hypothetical protein
VSQRAVKEALDELEERSWCAGTFRPAERIAIALPDGDVAAVDDPQFVAWLREHGEDAPFGKGGETVRDPDVRSAVRLVARGAATVAGFDPADVLPEIEAVLSPRRHLRAVLTDVLVYGEGGKFARHRDTPMLPELLGTLVVVLPIEHTGGAFLVDDGCRAPGVLDWGDPEPGLVRWVALYGDVEHEVEEVWSGARVSLTYALHVTDRPREDPGWPERRAQLAAAFAPLAASQAWPAMIACSRHVIIDPELQARGLDALRARDRDIADVLVAAGYRVRLRACAAASNGDNRRFPEEDRSYIHRLSDPLTAEALHALKLAITFADDAGGDDEDDEVPSDAPRARHPGAFGPYLVDENLGREHWVVRETAAATVACESYFSDSGYFGNEAYTALVYTLAAIEVTR